MSGSPPLFILIVITQQNEAHPHSLLADDRMAISQVALETGFAHQSHLALHMRRILGISPSELRRRRG